MRLLSISIPLFRKGTTQILKIGNRIKICGPNDLDEVFCMHKGGVIHNFSMFSEFVHAIRIHKYLILV